MIKGRISLAILTRQVTTYHHARFEAAARHFGRLNVIAVANEGKFPEIMSSKPVLSYEVYPIADGIMTYHSDAANGNLFAKVCETLDLLMPDVVAIAGWSSAESYAALSWARRSGRGAVVMSDSKIGDAQRTVLREWVKRRFVRLCDSGFVAGREHRVYLASLGMPDASIRLGYDVVDNSHFQKGALEARAESEMYRRKFYLPSRYILASSRFIRKKNLIRLVEAYGLAKTRTDSMPQLLIAGDGEQRSEIEQKVFELGLRDDILLPGFYNYDQLPIIYGLADGFIHVPLTEQWGLVVNEAAAAGVPLVLSEQCGAANELLQSGKNGWLVSALNTEGIAAALGELANLSTSKRKAMGRVSREMVQSWGPDRYAQELAVAARTAKNSRKALSILDRLIIQAMSRRVVETVQ